MKKLLIEYTCDRCGRIETKPAAVSPEENDYPFNKGWCYIESIAGLNNDAKAFIDNQKHFCSSKCAVEFCEQLISTEKEKMVVVDDEEKD